MRSTGFWGLRCIGGWDRPGQGSAAAPVGPSVVAGDSLLPVDQELEPVATPASMTAAGIAR